MGRARKMLAAVTAVVMMAGVEACMLLVDTDGLSGGAEIADAASDRGSSSSGDAAIGKDGATSQDATPAADATTDAPVDAPTGPPIAFVSASKADPVMNVSSIDLAKPAGVTSDDVILVALFTDFAATDVTTPAGYTKLKDTAIPSPTDTHGWFYIRVAGSGEPSKTTFVFNTSTQFASAIALAYRNVRAAAPVDVAAYGTSEGTSYIAPAVTTTLPRTMLVAMYLGDDTVGASWTAPAGTTQRAVTGIGFAADMPLVAAGAVGPIIATSDKNAGAETALVALAPAN